VNVLIDGKQIRELGKMASFGERALVFNERRSATIEASSPTMDVFTIDEQAFKGVITEQMKDALTQHIELQNTKVGLKTLKHVRLIGAGAFGSVRMVEHKQTGFRYALKRIKKKNGEVPEDVKRECQLLSENCHPFVLNFVATFETNASIYILTELITGGQLYEQVVTKMGTCMSKRHAQFYIGSLVLILEALHNHQIVYRDLKPENVMLDKQGFLKLVDLGMAKKLEEAEGMRTFTVCGSLVFMAPEVINGNGYGKGCDIWSLGVMLFEFVCGELPFEGEEDDDVIKGIVDGALEFPQSYNDSSGKNIMKALLTKDPQKRLGAGARGWEDIKGHKFFKQGQNDLFGKIKGRAIKPPHVPDDEAYSDERELKDLSLSDDEELGKDEETDLGCRMMAAFRKFDLDGDGKIDRKELGVVLQKIDKATFTDKMVDDMFSAVDVDDSGDIQFEEFIAWIFDEEGNDLRDMFRSVTRLDVSA